MNISESIIWYAIFVFSATLHEAAHAWAARRGGDLTAYLGGQVSLNPLKRIRNGPAHRDDAQGRFGCLSNATG